MAEKSYDPNYPVHVDLGRKVPDYGSPIGGPKSSKPKKTRTVYPSLYIEDAEDLANLQSDGWALIRYHRNSLTIRDPDKDEDDKNRTSAFLDVKEICLPDSGDDLATAFAKFAKKAGADTEGMGDGEEAESTPEEEEET